MLWSTRLNSDFQNLVAVVPDLAHSQGYRRFLDFKVVFTVDFIQVKYVSDLPLICFPLASYQFLLSILHFSKHYEIKNCILQSMIQLYPLVHPVQYAAHFWETKNLRVQFIHLYNVTNS